MPKTVVLDQLEKIRRIDKSGMLDLCAKIAAHCKDAVQRAKRIEVPMEVKVSGDIVIRYTRPKRVLVAGMGGSAIGGEILRDWLRDEVPVPIEVCNDYTLPAHVNKDTLVFAVSYSGNTEETLSAFMDAVKRSCMTIAVTSGGHLLSFAEKLKVPHLTIPEGILAPRAAIPYLFFSLPVLMEKVGLNLNVEEEVKGAVRVLEDLSKETEPQTPTKSNPSKTLALELEGTIPVVYGFGPYRAVAHRLKTELNENSKYLCRYDVFPELNHNEVMGWEAPEAFTKRFSVILLRDPKEPPEIRHKIETTKRLALHKARRTLELHARGEGKLARMFSILHVGDLASVYLAILQGIDPTPVETIERIKEEMGKRFSVTENLEREIQKITGNVA